MAFHCLSIKEIDATSMLARSVLPKRTSLQELVKITREVSLNQKSSIKNVQTDLKNARAYVCFLIICRTLKWHRRILHKQKSTTEENTYMGQSKSNVCSNLKVLMKISSFVFFFRTDSVRRHQTRSRPIDYSGYKSKGNIYSYFLFSYP